MLSFRIATPSDTLALVALRTATAQLLTEQHGVGLWSRAPTERGVLFGLRQTQVWLAHDGDELVASFALSTRKPWAIDKRFFAPSKRPLYLTDMGVHPDVQRRGVGRECLNEAARVARAFPADAIRLDAWDAAAGAGPFYARCGFTEVGRATYRTAALVYYELLL